MKSLIEMRQLMFLTNVYSVYYETPLRAALFFFIIISWKPCERELDVV